MINKFFLNYANHSLKEDPKYLRWLVSTITYHADNYVQEDIDLYDDIVRAIIIMVKDEKHEKIKDDGFEAFGVTNFLATAREIHYFDRDQLIKVTKNKYGKLLNDELIEYFLSVYDIAYQSIYGECIYCNYGKLKFGNEVITDEWYKEKKELKCYECDQLEFKHILSDIVKGKEYHTIDIFEYLIKTTNDVLKIRRETELRKEGKKLSPFEMSLKWKYIVEFPLINIRKGTQIARYDYSNPFRKSLMGAAIYSLTEFLLHSDRRKLKQCSHCKEFFIANKVDTRIKFCEDCSPKSKMSKEKRNKYMREVYRPRKKQEKLAIEREAKIENLISKGWTREEAKEVIEADLMM